MTTLQHEALIYDSDEEYVRSVAPFLAEGVARGDGVVVATHDRNRDAIARTLGADAAAVTFVPAAEVYASIPGAVRAYHAAVEGFVQRGHPSVRAIGEVAYPDAFDGWLAYESVAHAVFADAPLHVICPYDARALPSELVQHARRTHPELRVGDHSRHNHEFDEPEAVMAALPPLPHAAGEGPPLGEVSVGDLDQLAEGRHAFAEILRSQLPARRAREATLVASELLTNGIVHGGAPCSLTIWATPRGVVYQVRNDGPAIDDPFAGYRPPPSPEGGGMGLWVARQLADRLDIAHDGQGTVVTALFGRS